MEDQMTKQNVSNAWRLHREGNSAAAIDGFQSILASDSANIDALYGIGLAYRAIGQNERAVESLTAAQNALAVAEEIRLAEGEKPSQSRDSRFRIPSPAKATVSSSSRAWSASDW